MDVNIPVLSSLAPSVAEFFNFSYSFSTLSATSLSPMVSSLSAAIKLSQVGFISNHCLSMSVNLSLLVLKSSLIASSVFTFRPSSSPKLCHSVRALKVRRRTLARSLVVRVAACTVWSIWNRTCICTTHLVLGSSPRHPKIGGDWLPR